MSAGIWGSCSRCGASFECDPAGDCWCKTPPYLPMPATGSACLCPDCLAQAQKAAARRNAQAPPAS